MNFIQSVSSSCKSLYQRAAPFICTPQFAIITGLAVTALYGVCRLYATMQKQNLDPELLPLPSSPLAGSDQTKPSLPPAPPSSENKPAPALAPILSGSQSATQKGAPFPLTPLSLPPEAPIEKPNISPRPSPTPQPNLTVEQSRIHQATPFPQIFLSQAPAVSPRPPQESDVVKAPAPPLSFLQTLQSFTGSLIAPDEMRSFFTSLETQNGDDSQESEFCLVAPSLKYPREEYVKAAQKSHSKFILDLTGYPLESWLTKRDEATTQNRAPIFKRTSETASILTREASQKNYVGCYVHPKLKENILQSFKKDNHWDLPKLEKQLKRDLPCMDIRIGNRRVTSLEALKFENGPTFHPFLQQNVQTDVMQTLMFLEREESDIRLSQSAGIYDLENRQTKYPSRVSVDVSLNSWEVQAEQDYNLCDLRTNKKIEITTKTFIRSDQPDAEIWWQIKRDNACDIITHHRKERDFSFAKDHSELSVPYLVGKAKDLEQAEKGVQAYCKKILSELNQRQVRSIHFPKDLFQIEIEGNLVPQETLQKWVENAVNQHKHAFLNIAFKETSK